MKKIEKKIFSGAMGTAMLLGGAAAQAADVSVVSVGNQYTEADRQETHFSSIANVQGEFLFDQNVVTPADEIFSLFGTVVTGMCAKPGYALETGKTDFYINVGGKIRHAYTVDLKELEGEESTKTLLCACATGSATANAGITGIKLSSVLSLAEMDADVNTVTVRGADGYGMSLPLSYALDKEAMVVYRINNETIPSGTQLWVPGTVAKYFVRDVVDIELTSEQSVPEVMERDSALRAEIAIMNYTESTLRVGDDIVFEGYADDCGDTIAAVEFSLDGGETWTPYRTENATAERWVYWHFAYKAEAPGAYKLSVRARTEGGTVSPLAANVVFTVQDVAL